jgi:transposase InsO family protein
LQAIPVPQRPWSVIEMDFITKLPILGGFESIMVVIDLLSKVTHFIPCKETYTAEQLAQIFWSQIFKLHGMPEKIILDRGSTFVSEFWRAFLRSLRITPGFSTAYHPQTEGQTKKMNQVLEDYLQHFCSYYQNNWVRILDMAEFSINNLDSASLGTSPFFFANGFHPKFSMLTKTSGVRSLDGFLIDMQEIQERAIECLTQAKRRQALYYDEHWKQVTQYQPGDLVLLL